MGLTELPKATNTYVIDAENATEQEFDTLYHLAVGDMYGDFGAVSLVVTAWGKKPTPNLSVS